MKINHSIIFGLLMCCFIAANAQQISLKRSISWEKTTNVRLNTRDSLDLRSVTLLNFVHAIYPDHKNFLPFYSELIKIDTIGNYNQLDDVDVLKSSNCTDEEIRQISMNSALSEKVDFSYKLQYVKKEAYISILVFPFYKDTNTGEIRKIINFQLRISKKSIKTNKSMRVYADHSVLNTGKWFKFKITQDGMYSLSYQDLRNIGFSKPEDVRVFGNGGGMLPEYNNVKILDDIQETQILTKNQTIYFYAKGPNKWSYDSIKGMVVCQPNIYSNCAYYFLTDKSTGTSNQVPTAPALANIEQEARNYIYVSSHERQDTNILHSGQQWFGEIFLSGSVHKFNFNLPSIDRNSKGKLDINFVGRSQANHSYGFSLEDITKSFTLPIVNYGDLGNMFSEDEQILEYSQTTNSPTVSINYQSNSYDSNGWLDYITLNANCTLQKNDSLLRACFIERKKLGANTRFILTGGNGLTHLWNLNSYPAVNEVAGKVSGSETYFDFHTQYQLNQFVAFDESDPMLKPILSGTDVGLIQNQDLHGQPIPDMIIVTHPKFWDQAKEIEKIHQDKDQLKVLTVTTDLIYNEFSSGARDISAIKNFTKMFYDRAVADQTPRYLLLFGDGSFDNLNNLPSNTNFVPVYESPQSANKIDSYVSDDFYGMLDDKEGSTDGLLDIGIGRFPVKDQVEAETMVQKLKTYLDPTTMGDWRNYLCFIGDNADYNLHVGDADKLSNLVKTLNPTFNHEKIYLDSYSEVSVIGGKLVPDANVALANRINRGSLLVNYSGHGNENQLSAYKIINKPDILSWNNPMKLPVFITATCEFSRYDEYHMVTGGETLILKPQGGAVALFGTSRLVFQSENFSLNTLLYNYLFTKDRNGRLGLGEIMRLTKNALGSSTNKLNFTLLGDPALRLNYPQNNIQVSAINGHDPSIQQDTLRALNKLQIKGVVLSSSNVKDKNFNGKLDVAIFDKSESVKTLNNRGEGAFTYDSQNSVLYKGKASVSQGEFSIEFIIPKDINYSYGNGKISMYAENQDIDAAGFSSKLIIGGISNQASTDKVGPEIKLYMNDSNFVYGGTATPNSKLIAILKDESGINTAGRGIGHDITAVLDGNTSKEILLNDFYTASLNSYKSGKLEYYFKDLTVGNHTLKLKAWDVNNNSSEMNIEFYVSDVSQLQIDHVLNYPNPFTTHTDFFFEHNQLGKVLNAEVQIFTVTGKLVKTIFTSFAANGSRSEPISWDGKDDYGNTIGKGVYIYKINVSCDGLGSAYKLEKLLLLR